MVQIGTTRHSDSQNESKYKLYQTELWRLWETTELICQPLGCCMWANNRHMIILWTHTHSWLQLLQSKLYYHSFEQVLTVTLM